MKHEESTRHPMAMERSKEIEEAEVMAEALVGPLTRLGMETIEALITEIEDSEFGPHFNKKVTSDEMKDRLKPTSISRGNVSPITSERIDKEGEAGYKKGVLLANLDSARQELLVIAQRLKDVAINLKFSKSTE